CGDDRKRVVERSTVSMPTLSNRDRKVNPCENGQAAAGGKELADRLREKFAANGQASPLPVSADDLQNLRESGLTDDTIRATGIYTTVDEGELARLLNCGMLANPTLGGLVFPYYNLDDQPTGFARVRPLCPRHRDGKALKYQQALGSVCHAYVPA